MSKSTRKEKAKHEWITETQMFQRIAKTGEETYEELAAYWDLHFGKKTGPQAEVIAENMKTQRIILEAAGRAGRGRRS